MGYRPFILASSLFIALMSAPAAASEPIEVVHRPAELVVDGASSDWPGAAAVVDSDDVRSMGMLLAATDGVDIAVLFKVFREGKVKVSIRSPGNITINDVAATLGGGGHPFAAGADVMGTLDDVMERTLNMLREKLSVA